MLRFATFACVLALAADARAQDDGAVGSSGDDESANTTRGLHFEGYPDAPAFTVAPREGRLSYYPCDQCHQFMDTNPEVRELASPHPMQLEHGAGRMWCLSCHSAEDRDFLRTQLDEELPFEASFLVCGGCHADRQKDWYFGGHGRRVGNWQGERELLNCVHCHDPHKPQIEPRKPKAPPPVRVGLKRPAIHVHAAPAIWERAVEQQQEGDSNAH